ncbi:uncharacterized protein LOC113349033 isoform X5 [Papaver somniferum]|uniref:uncharacterized protein LOC113349033 isoform X5 n=1 Tax=Papaver somniferum TaxID=3469 RepID=UPI000E6FF22F|nr:uncharacterized protein LOC113349033 isoform X5 [Papaver somniferum]
MIKSISMGVEEESLDFELNITSFLFEEQIDDKLEVNSLFSRSTGEFTQKSPISPVPDEDNFQATSKTHFSSAVGAKPASHKFEFIPSSSDGHKENLMFLHYQEGYCGDTRILLDTMLPQSIFLWTEFMLARETKYWVAQNIFDQSLVGNISFTVHMEEVQECFVTSTSNSSQNLLNCISVKVGGLCYTSARSGKYFCDSPVLARTLFDRGKLFEAINRYSYHTTSNSHLSFGILIFSLLEVIRRYSCYVKCSSKSFLDTLSSCVFFILWKILKDEYNGDSFYELILQHGYQLDSRLINSITFVLVEECDNFYDRNLFAELSYRYSITSHGGGHILCLLEERIFTGKVLWLLLVVVSLEQL